MNKMLHIIHAYRNPWLCDFHIFHRGIYQRWSEFLCSHFKGIAINNMTQSWRNDVTNKSHYCYLTYIQPGSTPNLISGLFITEPMSEGQHNIFLSSYYSMVLIFIGIDRTFVWEHLITSPGCMCHVFIPCVHLHIISIYFILNSNLNSKF